MLATLSTCHFSILFYCLCLLPDIFEYSILYSAINISAYNLAIISAPLSFLRNKNMKMKKYLVLFLTICTLSTVYCINCYQCSGTDSNDPFECNEELDSNSQLKPINCEGIHNAQYCIKHVGRFEGGIGTKRYCSSLDLGNYCNYVQQPGDKLEYRTCIYTCSSDGCNA